VVRSTARVGQEEPAEACCGATKKAVAVRFDGGAVRRYMRRSADFVGIVSPIPTHRPTIAHPIDGSIGRIVSCCDATAIGARPTSIQR
jgi:hypothetical protein